MPRGTCEALAAREATALSGCVLAFYTKNPQLEFPSKNTNEVCGA